MAHQLDTLKAAVSDAMDKGTSLECDGCGLSSDAVGSDALIEHALFDHIGRAGLMVVKHAAMFSSFELALSAGLEPRTEAEVKWRAEHASRLLEPPAGE